MWSSRRFWKGFLALAGLNLALVASLLAIAGHPQGTGEHDQSRLVAAALAGSVLAALLAAYLLGRRVWRVHSDLRESIDAVAEGDFRRRVRAAGRDDLAALAAAFNQMQQLLDGQVSEFRAGRERLVTVIGSMIEGVLAVDAEERILLANEAGRQLLGASATSIVGRRLREATRNRGVHEAIARSFAQAEPVEAEVELPDAARRMLALRAVRLPGEPCPGVVAVLHDVTELRRLENLRREFVTNVSHELKTPLASIKASAETLRLGAVNDPEHNLAFLACIEEQAERLHQLILDLISLARVESGQEAFEVTDVPLRPVIEHCVAQHQPAAAAKRITLEVVPPAHPVLARADEDGLRTILDNLVNNAIKYTPEGGQVWVRWQQEDSRARLEVQDTGIGISQRDQTRVFERFFRVDLARSRELGGTGLGLAIVKHLAQAFGGSVQLSSKIGEGSTFQVRLPLAGT